LVETIEKTNLKLFYSTKQDGNGNLYLGGAMSTEEVSNNFLHNLLQKTTEDEQITGIQKFRCVYAYNDHESVYIKNLAAFIVADTTSPNDFVEVGWGSAEIGLGTAGALDDSIEQELPDQYTAPEDVTFYSGNVRSTGALLNDDLPPKKAKALWIKYTSLFDAQDFPYNTFKLRIVSDNLISSVLERDTSTLPPQVIFNIIGNCSSDADFTQLASRMLPSNPHFYVTTGNNNTEANPAFFFSVMGATNMAKTMLALGPIDYDSQTVLNAYLNEMAKYQFVSNPRRTYYSKTFHNVHVLVMNTSGSVPYTKPSAQYDFCLNDLQDAYTNPKVEWIFVVTNRPVYGPIVTNNQRFYYNDIAQTYHQMWVDNGVICVFQGQINWWNRMDVLKYNPENPLSPSVLAYDGPDNYTILGKKSFKDGVMFITEGSAGNIHDLTANQGGGEAGVRSFNTADFGYTRVIVENRLDVPKILIRHYITSRNVQIFTNQVTVTRMG